MKENDIHCVTIACEQDPDKHKRFAHIFFTEYWMMPDYFLLSIQFIKHISTSHLPNTLPLLLWYIYHNYILPTRFASTMFSIFLFISLYVYVCVFLSWWKISRCITYGVGNRSIRRHSGNRNANIWQCRPPHAIYQTSQWSYLVTISVVHCTWTSHIIDNLIRQTVTVSLQVVIKLLLQA